MSRDVPDARVAAAWRFCVLLAMLLAGPAFGQWLTADRSKTRLAAAWSSSEHIAGFASRETSRAAVAAEVRSGNKLRFCDPPDLIVAGCGVQLHGEVFAALHGGSPVSALRDACACVFDARAPPVSLI